MLKQLFRALPSGEGGRGSTAHAKRAVKTWLLLLLLLCHQSLAGDSKLQLFTPLSPMRLDDEASFLFIFLRGC